MDNIISDSLQNPINTSQTTSYNFNFKTIFLFIILIIACCLLCIGYNFDINNLFSSEISMVACCILTLFLFYVFYEFFKSDTCEDLSKTGWQRLKSSTGRGMDFFERQATRGAMNMGNALNYAGQQIKSPSLNNTSNYINKVGQPYLPPQYQNHIYNEIPTPSYNPVQTPPPLYNPVQTPTPNLNPNINSTYNSVKMPPQYPYHI